MSDNNKVVAQEAQEEEEVQILSVRRRPPEPLEPTTGGRQLGDQIIDCFICQESKYICNCNCYFS